MKQIAILNPFAGISVPTTGQGKIVNVNATSLGNIITQLLPYVFAASALLLLVYLVFGGLELMLSRGDPKAIQSAQGKITNALIGFVIVFLAWAIAALMGRIFGITVFRQIFG